MDQTKSSVPTELFVFCYAREPKEFPGQHCPPARSERRRRTPQARALERTRDCKACAFSNLLSASELTTPKLRRLVIRSLEETPSLQVGKCPLSACEGFPRCANRLRRATASAPRKARALHDTAGSAYPDQTKSSAERSFSCGGYCARATARLGHRCSPARLEPRPRRPRAPARGRTRGGKSCALPTSFSGRELTPSELSAQDAENRKTPASTAR
jgi:hypothetical protein